MTAMAGVRACVFDAYGTLFDFGSAVAQCAEVPDEKRPALTAIWRDKQIQYTLLRSMQRRYADFETVTAEALDYALDSTRLASGLRPRLLELYRTVSAYPEVSDTLRALRQRGLRTAILSNGTPGMLAAATAHAGISDRLDHVLSADTVGIYKPAAHVYQLAVDALAVPADSICFISSNGWDAHGAAVFGFRVVWCNRSGHPAERLPGTPRAVIADLAELPDLLDRV